MTVVDRALVIRREKNKRSVDYANVCVDSLDRCNMRHEFISAVENLDAADAASSVGIKMPKKSGGQKNTIFDHPECFEQGNACCTASHIKAWKRVIEIGKPCAILEHDAVVVRNFRNVKIEDNYLFFLGVRLRDPRLYRPVSRPRGIMQIAQAIGTHAYAISPATAKTLLGLYEKHGFMWGVDHFLFMNNECKLPVVAMDPYPAMCWSRESTMMDHTEKRAPSDSFSKDPFIAPRGVVAGINDQNMFYSMTPGFLEGMGIPIHYQVNK